MVHVGCDYSDYAACFVDLHVQHTPEEGVDLNSWLTPL